MDPAVTRRVLDYMLFMNSKVLFKQARPAAPLLRCCFAASVPLLPRSWIHCMTFCEVACLLTCHACLLTAVACTCTM